MKRKIVKIDEEKCDGCGLCVPDCAEGALQIIDGKARLISDLFCDGLGACLGSCPQGAIEVEEREAVPYDERRVMEENIIKAGANTIKAHLKHLKEHGEFEYLRIAMDVLEEYNLPIPDLQDVGACQGQCPGSTPISLDDKKASEETAEDDMIDIQSQLKSWPVQLQLLNPMAPYLKNADLLIAADCAPFAYANFHRDFIKGKVVIVFCPKLDQVIDSYIEKLSHIFKFNDIKSITIARMEVPCCGGIEKIIELALHNAGVDLKPEVKIVSIQGDLKD